MQSTNKKTRGFTLIEILVVIGLIAILAAIVLIAINPARQFAQARNAQRESNVNTILNAIGQNLADNKGVLTCSTIASGVAIPVSPAAAVSIGNSAATVDLDCLVPTYIASAMPLDPTLGTAANSLYTIVSTSSRYTICAPNHAETAISGSAAFCLTR